MPPKIPARRQTLHHAHRLASPVARPVELSGISIVLVGSFNPALFHPTWFAKRELIGDSPVQEALEREQVLVTPDLSSFSADWLGVQVTQQQAVFSTVEEGREFDLRDLVVGVFELLPETPVDAVGINTDVHFRLESEEDWHAFGDKYLPKDLWEPLFQGERWRRRPDGHTVGMRTLTVEAWREDVTGFLRIEIAPSVRITPHGVYTGINAHLQLTTDENRSNGFEGARTVAEQWEDTRALERELLDSFLEEA